MNYRHRNRAGAMGCSPQSPLKVATSVRLESDTLTYDYLVLALGGCTS